MIAASTKTKILHLEDQSSDAFLVERILNRANIESELKLVSSREDYILALEEFVPELILSDHNLPAFDSIEALKILRKSNLKIPFILVTGTVSEEFAVEAMLAGADDYILKDRLQRLPVAIQRVLEKYRLAQEKIKSDTLLRNIDANSLDMICSVSEAGYFLHVSAASEAILGYTPAELIGKRPYDLLYPEDVQKTIEAAEYVMSGNVLTNFQNRYVRKDSSLVTLSWSARWDEQDRVRYGVARDVTEIRKLEYAHRSEQQRFIDLFLEAPAAIGILKGPTHVYQLFNPLYQRFTGRKDIIGKTVAEVFPELESQGLIKLLDKVYQTGKTINRKEVLLKIHLDNSGKFSDVYCNYVVQPYRNEQGEVEGVFFFSVDVTEQVLTRKKIEEAEKRYRQIVETAQEGIWVVDEHDKTTFVNSKMCELFEYTYGEMMGKDIYAFMDAEGKEIAVNLMQEIRAGRSGRGHFKYISKTSREIWTNISANPLFGDDGSYEGALAMITDITEQKKIEEENKKLSDVASLTVNAVIVTDPEARITWVNRGFERITEYTLAEVIGNKPGHILQGPKTDSATGKYMSECIRSGQGFRVEILNYSKSGREYWLDIEVRPLHNSQNKLTGFMAIEQDITEKKTVELERLALINSLQNRNKELQQFSYIVSHNLRAPLAKIMGLVSVMESESDESKFLLEKLAEEATRLDVVVKDINTIVSARNSAKEKMEPVSLEVTLNLIKQVLEDQIADSRASIVTDFSAVSELCSIKSYIYSILYNLISNSIKYRKTDVPPYIEVKSMQDEKFICLSVKDNGEGIDLVKNGSKLFGLYKRFHTGSVSGKGIGLNLVKTHAESLGGRVEIESELTIGTTFRVYIPKYEEKNSINA
ncbi:MAG: PAS domain S-box protein [Cyclobacteriaceae bacterium]|nr:PAS domain S-box protein [Cyclobacteriaceae bacterium]